MASEANGIGQVSDRSAVAVMFSGGRDSSLAVVGYCLQGRSVHLLRFLTGIGIPSELPALREAELRREFADQILVDNPLPVYGLVRSIALANIESDFRNFDGKNLILLGEKLAIHSAALVFCIRSQLRVLADGTSGYQAEMPEQRPVAIEFFDRLSQDYGVSYETPLRSTKSEIEVKYSLLEAGISTKSLEGLSMFADSFSFAEDTTVVRYLRSKEAIARGYIERFGRA